MKQVFSLFILFNLASAFAQMPDGNSLLEKIDQNMASINRITTARMVIHGRRESRTIEARSWVQGTEKAFTEYLSPAREKGTKMLKLGEQLWIYSPTTDRTIQISGHMLRQSVMGSDLSYEDMMQDPKLANQYQADVIGTEKIDNRMCWVLTLTAKAENITYHSRKLWVDQEREIPLQEELYAKSGKLLKKAELKDIRRIQNRWYPMCIVFRDTLKTGAGTEFITLTIEFDQAIPEHLFSKAALKR